MGTLKISRGSYIQMKKYIGKDPDTIYFGYDSSILKGLFLGDNEITNSIKNISLNKNVDDNRYIDLSLYIVDDDGVAKKTTCKIYNSTVLTNNLADINTLITNIQKDVSDISTRLSTFKSDTNNKFKQVSDISTKFSIFKKDTNDKFNDISTRLSTFKTEVNNRLKKIDISLGTIKHDIENNNINWVDLD